MNRLKRALNILFTGRESGDSGTSSDMPNDIPDLQSKVYSLSMDIEERDKKIENMTKEFSRLRSLSEKETGIAGEDALAGLAKKAAPVLTQIVTMQSLFEQGEDIKAKDLFALFKKVEKVFIQTGLTRIGEVGEETAFDSRIHKRLSGGNVHDGNKIVIRFVGYTFNQSVISKALTSRRG